MTFFVGSLAAAGGGGGMSTSFWLAVAVTGVVVVTSCDGTDTVSDVVVDESGSFEVVGAEQINEKYKRR